MKKFKRLNKQTKEKELFIGCIGILSSIDDDARENKVSKKPYYRFTAEVETPNGTTLIGGQVYEALIPYIGKTPEVGDKLDFNAKVIDLEAGFNTRWNIGGMAVDSVDGFIGLIGDLPLS